jgi:hypothetical protein
VLLKPDAAKMKEYHNQKGCGVRVCSGHNLIEHSGLESCFTYIVGK